MAARPFPVSPAQASVDAAAALHTQGDVTGAVRLQQQALDAADRLELPPAGFRARLGNDENGKVPVDAS